MRIWHAFVLTIFMVLGQIEICHGQYVRADGTPCNLCEVSTSLVTAKDSPTLTATDCTSCCDFKECGKDHASQTKWSAPTPSSLVLALPTRLNFLVVPDQFEVVAIGSKFAPYLPNAPPSDTFGRAPPVLVS